LKPLSYNIIEYPYTFHREFFMLRHTFLAVLFCFVLSISASGGVITQAPSEHLSLAVQHFKAKDYRAAQVAARQAPAGGMRDFLIGMSAYKSSEWEEAASALARAAETFPILADYAFYYQADAIFRRGQYANSIPPLEKLLKEYPDASLHRPALLLIANARFEGKEYPAALAAYQRFIEKYPAGNDSLTALLRSALCQEQMGDTTAAAAIYRSIWLKYPAADVAGKAEENLQRLVKSGIDVKPFSADELFKRGSTLYDLSRFDLAAKVFASIPVDTASPEFKEKLALKTAQTLVKARRYRDAEPVLRKLLTENTRPEIAAEGTLWLGRIQDKTGRDEDALATFQKLIELYPTSEFADDALLESAYIRKFQNRSAEALPFLQRLLTDYPRSSLTTTAQWEMAWGSYLTGNFPVAAELFQKLTAVDAYREKALYWGGKTLIAVGDAVGAQSFFSSLLSEYPVGYYALTYRASANLSPEATTQLPTDVVNLLPLPNGLDRVKTLIACGLYEEASRELAGIRKNGNKNQGQIGLARLYLEMGDYNGAIATVRNERPDKVDSGKIALWGLLYPCGFRDTVAKNAASCGISESLVYSLIRAESNYSPTVKSPAGAIGLMQLMPATASAIAGSKNGKFNPDNLTSPELNIVYGTKHLKDLIKQYNGDEVLAIAAYNSGAHNVNRWRKTFDNLRQDEFIESIPFGETREYVKKVLTGASLYRQLYGLKDVTSPTAPLPFRNTSSSGKSLAGRYHA
jgi:soluble lytic murein transglycosylase